MDAEFFHAVGEGGGFDAEEFGGAVVTADFSAGDLERVGDGLFFEFGEVYVGVEGGRRGRPC